ncbi:MAG: hypothetical protein K0U12_01535 [Gammaproteobacteria bacterium]|nr:hypothetical protein [Gammaproteobacteria bacterium]
MNFIKELVPIRDFIDQHRQSLGVLFDSQQLLELADLFKRYACLELNFKARAPLSVMETLTIAVTVLTRGYKQRTAILGIPKESIRAYEKRAKRKLGADSVTQAICLAIQRDILRII